MIELANVIRNLRQELEQSITAAEGEALRFELGPIELEVSVALERTGQAGGKVRFWVVESGAEATRGTVSTQHLKLTLQPTLSGSDASPFVAGPAEADEQ
ncbi:trypco2 family protein [Streptomyces sp. NPDC000151]|uniref:trypco2 family protein n=1 Tax=Streptomyces sp. NPDC000151 TaxID=3154244 RepID=UPI0033322DDE